MKRRMVTVIVCLLLVMNIASVDAASSVSFETYDSECDVDRIFSIDMKATSNAPLSAATFEVRYDKSLVEFRGVESDDTSTVYANETQDSVKISYLCRNGKDISQGDTLFAMKFKSLNSGNFNLKYSVSDPVDCNVQSMYIGSCESGQVTVTGKTDNGEATVRSSSEKGDSSMTDRAITNTPDDSEAVVNISDQDNSDSQAYDTDEKKSNSAVVIIIAVGGILIITMLTGLFIGKNFAGKRRTKPTDD